jgi:regulator of cell morphogenesis and NO signaling
MNPRTYEELISTTKMYELITERLDESSLPEKQTFEGIELNHELVELILDLYDNDSDADFFHQKLRKFSLEEIVTYIQASHRYYLTKKVPELEQSLLHIFSKFGQTHQLLASLALFFNQYKNKLVRHFKLEESLVLPYIKKMILADRGLMGKEELTALFASQSIRAFTDHHDEVEEELKEVSVIIHNFVEQGEQPPLPYRIFLNQVELFEMELRKHALIEDHVLVPLAEELEKKLKESL